MHPILFRVPFVNLPIYSYGVMLALSLFVAWHVIMFLAAKERLSRELMSSTFLWTAVFALVGARLLYVFTNLDSFASPAEWLNVREGGIVAYGGFLGGFFASWGYLRLKRAPLLAWGDVAAPGLGTGLLFTRIGCYLFGCDFGARLPETAPGWLKALGSFPHWQFPNTGSGCAAGPSNGSPAWAHHVAHYGLASDAAASFPVHPTQLYESAAGAVLLIVTLLVWRRRAFRGQVLLSAAVIYSIFRFFIEFLRDDPERGGAIGLSTSQIISLVLLPVSVIAYVRLARRARIHGDPPIPAHALQPDPAQATPPAASKTPLPRKRRRRK